tara:strand:- start:10 stop:186 length:177 start_codon:yes stop_codon:yes gene_type:complete
MHINNIHKTDGVNFVKPSEILAKLFEAIPNIIPFARNKYPNKGFTIIYSPINLPSKLQ